MLFRSSSQILSLIPAGCCFLLSGSHGVSSIRHSYALQSDRFVLLSLYEYYILNVTLTNKTLPAVILPWLDEQQREIYTVMQQLKGNKP